MEYVYAALVLHEAEKELSEDNVTAVLEAAGIEADDARVKSLVAAMEDVDVEEAIAQSAGVPAGGAPAGGAPAGGAEEESADEEPEEEEEEPEADEGDDDDDDEDAGEGLGELFG
jgi:large subunit ribosomal protein L12